MPALKNHKRIDSDLKSTFQDRKGGRKLICIQNFKHRLNILSCSVSREVNMPHTSFAMQSVHERFLPLSRCDNSARPRRSANTVETYPSGNLEISQRR